MVLEGSGVEIWNTHRPTIDPKIESMIWEAKLGGRIQSGCGNKVTQGSKGYPCDLMIIRPTGTGPTGTGPDPDRTRTGVTYAEQRLLIMDHGSWIMDHGSWIKD